MKGTQAKRPPHAAQQEAVNEATAGGKKTRHGCPLRSSSLERRQLAQPARKTRRL